MEEMENGVVGFELWFWNFMIFSSRETKVLAPLQLKANFNKVITSLLQ